jgi:uncharacterized protein
LDPSQLAIAFVCLALGGVLKGATGAGAPILAIPALAMMFDVQFAVIVMLMPNLITNGWQAWACRRDLVSPAFASRFAAAGGFGVFLGTFVLAALSSEALSLIVAFAVFCYILFRFARPDWMIGAALGLKLAPVMGMAAGLLQGSSGISAPVSLSFLNALRPARRDFMAIVSIFFAGTTLVQIPTLSYLGLVTLPALGLSLLAVLPIFLFMPLGAWLARRMSPKAFDRLTLALLGGLAIKLVADSLLA